MLYVRSSKCFCNEIASSHSGVLMSMSFPWMRSFDPDVYYYYYYHHHHHHHYQLQRSFHPAAVVLTLVRVKVK